MARVIRGRGAVVPGEVIDAREEAERTVADAQTEARRIIAEAQAAAVELRREATERGRAEAEADAAALLIDAASARDGALAAAEAEVTRLALAAAEHIVGQELEIAPDRAIAIVRDVLTRARRAKNVSVRVHPDDEDRVAAALSGVEVVSDAAIARGGCVVDTNLGRLDARLEVRLSALGKTLGV